MRNLEELLNSLPAERQKRVAAEYQTLLRQIPLRTLREDAKITQQELAERLGTSQAAVSRVENRTDMLLSTFFSFVRAIGASASLHVKLKDEEYFMQPHFDEGCKAVKDTVSFTITQSEKVLARASNEWMNVGIVKPMSLRLPMNAPAANDAGEWSPALAMR